MPNSLQWSSKKYEDNLNQYVANIADIHFKNLEYSLSIRYIAVEQESGAYILYLECCDSPLFTIGTHVDLNSAFSEAERHYQELTASIVRPQLVS